MGDSGSFRRLAQPIICTFHVSIFLLVGVSLVQKNHFDQTFHSYFISRSMLAFIYVPLLQRELDLFRNAIWNNHRGRKQKNKELPAGIPEHIYHFHENYGGAKCGIHVTFDASFLLWRTVMFFDVSLRR